MITIVDDKTVVFDGNYDTAFGQMRALLIEAGGTLRIDDLRTGALESKHKYGINPTGLRINAQFRRANGNRTELTVTGRFGDAFDTTGAAAQKSRDILNKFVTQFQSAGTDTLQRSTSGITVTAASVAGTMTAAPIVGSVGFAHRGKSKTTAALLGFLLGGIGLHRFYLGSWGLGIIYLILLWVLPGAGLVLGILEAIRFFAMKQPAFDAAYNYRPVTAFSF